MKTEPLKEDGVYTLVQALDAEDLKDGELEALGLVAGPTDHVTKARIMARETVPKLLRASGGPVAVAIVRVEKVIIYEPTLQERSPEQAPLPNLAPTAPTDPVTVSGTPVQA